MKFLVCQDPQKIKHHEVYQYHNYYYCHDDEVNVHTGADFVLLWQGYTIEQPIEELLNDWHAFKYANGNFFAVRITAASVDFALDYFNSHKLFQSDKYGFEMSNHLPWMTIREEDITRKALDYEPFIGREYDVEDRVTFFRHIQSLFPDFDYVGDAKHAYNSKVRNDPDELVDFIHECMESHANVIKQRYANRFICLSEGMDSVLQSHYFFDDPQHMYNIVPGVAGKDGVKYKDIVLQHFPDVSFQEFQMDRAREYTHTFLNDASTRWPSIVPTMKQIAENDTKPDIVLFGVNGDEMFFRGLIPHIQTLSFEYWHEDKDTVVQKIQEDVRAKQHQYGAAYTLGDEHTFEHTMRDFLNRWYSEERSLKETEKAMLTWSTPIFYTRAISQNNEVIAASLYNDRRIYHEVLKCPKDWIREHGMDTPIQKKILKNKFNYELVTPHKDAMFAAYEDIMEHIFDATIEDCLKDLV